ncbi:MAG: hypothetical protein ACR2RD_16610 [Woeseiaceae bacterium]
MSVNFPVPEDNADLAKLDIHLPSVPSEEVSGPAEIEPYLLEYLKREGFPPNNGEIDFIKIVRIEGVIYWIWRFDSDGDSCYATATQKSDGSTGVGCDTDYWDLTPDQYIFGDYHECF